MKPKHGHTSQQIAIHATPLEQGSGLDEALTPFIDDDGDLLTADIMSTRGAYVYYPPAPQDCIPFGRPYDGAGVTLLINPSMSWPELLRCLGKVISEASRHLERLKEVYTKEVALHPEERMDCPGAGSLPDLDNLLLAGALLLHEDVRPLGWLDHKNAELAKSRDARSAHIGARGGVQ